MNKGKSGSWQIILFSLVSIFYASISLYIFYDISTQVTDENIYSEPPSKIYISSYISARKITYPYNLNSGDGIRSGALLLSIDDKKYENETQVYNFLDGISENDSLKFSIFILTPGKKSSGINSEYILRKGDLPKDFLTYLPSCVLIQNVISGGVSDIAGLRTGDLIVKIHGKNFSSSLEANRLMQTKRKDKLIKYTILRNNRLIDIDVKLAKYGLELTFIVSYFIGLAILLLGIYILLFRFYLIEAKLTGFGLLNFGFIISIPPARLASSEELVALYTFIISICLLIGFPVFLYSLNYIPFRRKRFLSKKLLSLFPIILGLIFYLFFIFEYLFLDSSYINQISTIFLLGTIFYYGIMFLFFNEKKSRENTQFGRAIYLSVWAFCSFLIVQSAIIWFNLFEYFPDVLKILNTRWLLHFILLMIPLSYIYTIAKYSLLEKLIRITKSLQYTILNVLATIAFYLITFYLIVHISGIEYPIPNIHFTGNNIEVIDSPLSISQNIFYGKILSIILSALVIYVLYKIKNNLIKSLDKRFHIVKLDYKDALEEIAQIVQQRADLNFIAENIGKIIASLMQVKRVAVIFFENEQKIASQFYYGIESKDIKEYSKSKQKELIASSSKFDMNFLLSDLPENISSVYSDCGLKYIFPVRSKSELLGILLIGDKMSEKPFKSDENNFITLLTRQAAIGVENNFLISDLAAKERMKQELDIARRIQMSSLPSDLPDIKGLEISAMSSPAMEVGGDFYDFYLNQEKTSLTAIVGDVSGKGTSAALYMSKIQGILSTLQEFENTPSGLLSKSNKLIYSYLEKSAFITATCIRFDTENKSAIIARAGHLPIYYYNHKLDKIESIIPKGIVLGMNTGELFDRNLEDFYLDYQVGDFFVLLTDGVTEARDQSGNEFGEDFLKNILFEEKNKKSSEIITQIKYSLDDFIGNAMKETQFDDITIVVIKVV
jgi:phosphoserine phosphatase RsbU/P